MKKNQLKDQIKYSLKNPPFKNTFKRVVSMYYNCMENKKWTIDCNGSNINVHIYKI